LISKNSSLDKYFRRRTNKSSINEMWA
jgi:hypothetical protein